MPSGIRKDGTKLGFRKGNTINKGRKLSEKHKKKISKGCKGKTGFWRSKRFSKEHRENLSKSHKGNKHFNWNGGEQRHDSGRILVYVPYHPNARKNYYWRARLVMEKHLGRFLTKKEVVHHKNKKVDDDRIENLELFKNQSEHIKNAHNTPYLKKICKFCKKEFRTKREKQKYCSLECFGLDIRKRIEVICPICKKVFYTTPFHKKNGRGKHCSIKCRIQSQRNKKCSEETKRKISESLRRRNERHIKGKTWKIR